MSEQNLGALTSDKNTVKPKSSYNIINQRELKKNFYSEDISDEKKKVNQAKLFIRSSRLY
jgi:hypothetical protein